MKPITADNTEGRVLLALRAGPMTPGEVHGRVNTSVPSSLIKSGLVVQDSSYYRITEAGRAACPFRNPLAAPKGQPAYQEPNMARENVVTRQQVLAVIKDAGAAGIAKSEIVQKFSHLVAENAITSHLVMLKKDGAITSLTRGIWCLNNGVQPPDKQRSVMQSLPAMPATREAVMRCLQNQGVGSRSISDEIAEAIGCDLDSTKAVLAGLYASLKIDREKAGDDFFYFIPMPKDEAAPAPQRGFTEKQITEFVETLEPEPIPQAPHIAQPVADEMVLDAPVETIEIKGISDRRAPVVLDQPDATVIGIFSDGQLEITDSFHSFKLTQPVVAKLRGFLGLFSEAL